MCLTVMYSHALIVSITCVYVACNIFLSIKYIHLFIIKFLNSSNYSRLRRTANIDTVRFYNSNNNNKKKLIRGEKVFAGLPRYVPAGRSARACGGYRLIIARWTSRRGEWMIIIRYNRVVDGVAFWMISERSSRPSP